MSGEPPPPPPDEDVSTQPPTGPDPTPGPPAQVPWTPELPGAPVPLAPASLPPVPGGYGVAPPPVSRGRRWLNRRLLIVVAVIVVLVVAAVIGSAISSSHRSRLPLVGSQSTDGTFHSGDCVSLSATRVTKSDCGGAHDAQVIQVIHGNQTCPGGTQEFDVNDGTGNLCLDSANKSKG
jgi:hypothetical protein